MIHEPLVSIIIPVYNVEPYLEEALDSVIHQTYKKLEILIVDDGSTDRSGVICDEYASREERISVIHQENRGLSAARNAGLDRMTGDVCAFLDSDDAYEDTFVEKMLAVMLREDVDVVVCKYSTHQTEMKMRMTSEQTMPSGISGNYDRVHALRALADATINVSVWNKLYRRELWQIIRYPDGHVYEDIFTSFCVFDICNMVYVLDEPLYLHRNRKDSITTTPSMKNIRDINLACAQVASFIALKTPEVFTSSHEQKWRQRSLNGMIVIYFHCTNGTSYKEIAFRKELREMILLIGSEMGIEALGLRTRIAWYMLRRWPWLLKTVYSVYRPIRLLVLRRSGRSK